MLEALFDSGRVVDLILLIVVLEAVVLSVVWRRAGRRRFALLANLSAGAFLLLALRGVMMNTSYLLPAAALCAAGCAHVIDLALRWRES